MAAGLGFKTFTSGEVLTAADTNGYLMQGINVFASTAARNAAITSPQEGQFAFTKDTNSLWYYDGAAWVASGATGDIEGVTAGVGISGGGTSGTVTVTNSMATAIDAKGDLIGGTGADAFSRLAVGANNTVLTADSAEATGLKWATASSGAMVLVKARTTFTTVTDTSTTFDGVFTSTYKNYIVILDDINGSVGGGGSTLQFQFRYGTTTQASYNGNTNQVSKASAVTNINSSAAATAGLGQIYSGDQSLFQCTISGVAVTNRYAQIVQYGWTSAIEGSLNGGFSAGNTRNYDGFILSASSGTITGSATVYGLVVS